MRLSSRAAGFWAALPARGFSRNGSRAVRSHEQTQKVGKNYPFVADMRDEPGSACTGFEACEKNLVDDDCRETDERHAQRMVMKKRDAQQS